MTLKDLAAASKVSVSMLSQVERGQREPTLPVALRIAEGLGCYLSEMLDDPADGTFGLVRLSEAPGTLDAETGVRRLLLSRHLPPAVAEVTWYRLPSGARVGPFVHRDSELVEQIALVAGRIRATVGPDVHELRPGDTLTYPGSVEHRFENTGRSEASYVHIAHRRR